MKKPEELVIFFVTQLSCFFGVGVSVDLFEQTKVEQLGLKAHDFGVSIL